MKEFLLPCPLCSSRVKTQRLSLNSFGSYNYTYYVTCTSCGFSYGLNVGISSFFGAYVYGESDLGYLIFKYNSYSECRNQST